MIGDMSLAAPLVGGFSSQSVPGNSIMPPSKPFSGRRRIKTRPRPSSIQKPIPGVSAWPLSDFRKGLGIARQRDAVFRHGHDPQSGPRSLQRTASSSINPWAKSPASPGAA